MRTFVSIAALLLTCPLPALAQTLPPPQKLPDAKLAELRGGFDLPGGLNVTIGVTTGTSVDGREVLRTVFDVRDGAPQLSVLDGQNRPVTLSADGSAVATADGMIRLRSMPGGSRVELSAGGLNISHLVGQSLGSIVANTGNSRSIDVTTTVDIGLSGVRPDAIGGSAAQVANMALDSTSRLVR